VIKEAIATGDTVEQAFEEACNILGVESHNAEFEILELPVKKTFGLFGGNPAKVRAFIKSSPSQAAAEYLQKILSCMGLPNVDISITEEENGALLSLSGDDIGFIIGHRGETLDALQYLTGLVANHVDDSYYRITIDIGNYRKKRMETLEILGKKIAAKALKIGRNCSLEPMNPYERRIIHTAVQTVEGAKSWSEGEESMRHVVIGPENGEKPSVHKNNFQNGYNKQRDYGNRNGSPRKPGGYNKPYNNIRPRTDSFNSKPQSEPVKQQPKAESVSAPLYGRIDPKN
jgi:spoIIIJ-associated protein